MLTLAELMEYGSSRSGVEGSRLIEQAWAYAEGAHEGHERLSGGPYFNHSVAVAAILAEWCAPAGVIAAGLLHDVAKQKYSSNHQISALEDHFGSETAKLVKAIQRLGRFGPSLVKFPHLSDQDAMHEGNQEARLSIMTAELRRNPLAVVIKLADRVHNLKNLEVLPEERQSMFTAAVLNLFVPFAHRLGMRKAARHLQDAAFALREPEPHQAAERRHREAAAVAGRLGYPTALQYLLKDVGIEAEVDWTVLNTYQIHHRMLERGDQHIPSGQLLTLRVVVPEAEDCYRGLRTAHEHWTPKNEMQDYVAVPQSNGYRAVHTRVFDEELNGFDIAFTTHQMALVNDYGYTARWRDVDSSIVPTIDPLPDRPEGYIMVLTPKGEVRYLPDGATPVDFAYHIHTELGHRFYKAHVNGRAVDPLVQLQDGDIVKIISGDGSIDPRPEWADGVVTDSARQAIRRYARQRKQIELTIDAWDRTGLVGEIADICYDRSLTMTHFHADALQEGKAKLRIGIGHIGDEEIKRLKAAIDAVSHVRQIEHVEFKSGQEIAPLARVKRNATGSPFTLGPVSGRAFVGRRDELERIVYSLQGKDSESAVLLWGQQRIGKTSILKELQRERLPTSEDYLTVFVDMHAVPGQPIGFFLHRIMVAIHNRLHSDELTPPNPSKMKRRPIYYFRRYIDRLERVHHAHSLLVLIDEFQGIGDLKEIGASREEVFASLRSLVQHSAGVNFLFTGGGLLEDLRERSGLATLMSVVDQVQLGHLEKADARELLTERQDAAEYGPDAIDELLRITRCHPCYLQFLAGELCLAVDGRPVEAADVERMAADVLQRRSRMASYFEHFWRLGRNDIRFSAECRVVLSAIVELTEQGEWAKLDRIVEAVHPWLTEKAVLARIEALEEYGTIEPRRLQYRVQIPLFEEWMRVNYPVKRSVVQIGE